ncbi:MAG: class II glutamine amidotransferase [Nanoarchaeota archaeon]
MCRLFALASRDALCGEYWFFKSEIPFKDFSERKINKGPHNSGWGIAWLEGDDWKVFKQGKKDFRKYDFNKVKETKSKNILIHLRDASFGDETTKNAHPFLYKNYVFEHNGSIDRKNNLSYLNDNFKNEIKSETDSEVYFLLIMQFLEETKNIIEAISKTLEIVKKYRYTGLNFIMGDSKKIYAYRDFGNQPGNENYYTLKYLAVKDSIVISSDSLSEDNWIPLKKWELLIVENDLKTYTINL